MKHIRNYATNRPLCVTVAMTLSAEQVDWLRANDGVGDLEPLPLPVADEVS